MAQIPTPVVNYNSNCSHTPNARYSDTQCSITVQYPHIGADNQSNHSRKCMLSTECGEIAVHPLIINPPLPTKLIGYLLNHNDKPHDFEKVLAKDDLQSTTLTDTVAQRKLSNISDVLNVSLCDSLPIDSLANDMVSHQDLANLPFDIDKYAPLDSLVEMEQMKEWNFLETNDDDIMNMCCDGPSTLCCERLVSDCDNMDTPSASILASPSECDVPCTLDNTSCSLSDLLAKLCDERPEFDVKRFAGYKPSQMANMSERMAWFIDPVHGAEYRNCLLRYFSFHGDGLDQGWRCDIVAEPPLRIHTFLLHLLVVARDTDLVEWTSARDFTFKVVSTERLGRLWNRLKANKCDDKQNCFASLSRAIRCSRQRSGFFRTMYPQRKRVYTFTNEAICDYLEHGGYAREARLAGLNPRSETLNR